MTINRDLSYYVERILKPPINSTILLISHQNSNAVINIATLLPFSAIFDETPLPAEEYVKNIKREILLEVATQLLAVDRTGEHDDYKRLTNQMLSECPQQVRKEILSRIEKYSQKENSEVLLLNILSSLDFFALSWKIDKGEEIQGIAEIQLKIFKSYLVLNELIDSKQRNVKATISGEKFEKSPALYNAAATIAQYLPYTGLTNISHKHLLISQFLKSFYLIDFLKENLAYQYLLEPLLVTFKCEDWDTFFIKLCKLAFGVFNVDKGLNINFTFNDLENDPMLPLLQALELPNSDWNPTGDYAQMRATPFYKNTNNSYQVVYSVFCAEMFYKALYFKIKDVNDKYFPEKTKTFKSHFCDDFSESYLLYRIIEDLFPFADIKVSGKKAKEFLQEGEPDYYMRVENSIFIFESKDFLVRAEVRESFDFAKYEEAFKKRLWFSKEGNGAVRQLTRNIIRVLDNEIPFDQHDNIHSFKIYPIVILHDQQYNCPGLNQLTNMWFNTELNEAKQLREGDFPNQICPITLIDIDTLIYVQDLIKNGTIDFRQILDDYHARTSIIKNDHYYLETFQNYLLDHIKSLGLTSLPQTFLDKTSMLISSSRNV